MKKKNHTRAWLEGESYHSIRNRMLGSHAWRAATHLQRSMISTLLFELGEKGGRNNGNLIFTDRNFRAFGFSFDAIEPNLNAVEALGFIVQKRGRAGTKGYGKARRILLPFMPILDEDGKEIEPPSDPWARFSTTKEAKIAARRAYRRAKSSPPCSRNRSTSLVLQKSEHVARKRNRKSNGERPMDIEFAIQKSEHVSRSKNPNQVSPRRDEGEVGQQGQKPPMMKLICIGGEYSQDNSCCSAHVRFPLLRLV
jgi:hypothetical protein